MYQLVYQAGAPESLPQRRVFRAEEAKMWSVIELSVGLWFGYK